MYEPSYQQSRNNHNPIDLSMSMKRSIPITDCRKLETDRVIAAHCNVSPHSISSSSLFKSTVPTNSSLSVSAASVNHHQSNQFNSMTPTNSSMPISLAHVNYLKESYASIPAKNYQLPDSYPTTVSGVESYVRQFSFPDKMEYASPMHPTSESRSTLHYKSAVHSNSLPQLLKISSGSDSSLLSEPHDRSEAWQDARQDSPYHRHASANNSPPQHLSSEYRERSNSWQNSRQGFQQHSTNSPSQQSLPSESNDRLEAWQNARQDSQHYKHSSAANSPQESDGYQESSAAGYLHKENEASANCERSNHSSIAPLEKDGHWPENLTKNESSNENEQAKSYVSRTTETTIQNATNEATNLNSFLTTADNTKLNVLEVCEQKCQICLDKASGFHYGAWSCEGCKAFFKRSLQGQIQYLCPGSNTCTIDKIRRKCCQSCRLRRCFESGMKLEYLQLSGSRKRSRRPGMRKSQLKTVNTQKFTEESNKTGSGPYTSEVPQCLLNVRKNNEEIVSEKDFNISSTGNKMLNHLLEIESVAKSNHSSSSTKENPRMLFTSLVGTAHEQLLNVIDWAKEIPEFNNVGVIDRTDILASCWTDLIIIGVLWKSLSTSNAIIFSSELTLKRECCDTSGILSLYNRLISLVKAFQQLKVTQSEMVLLRITILLNAATDITAKYPCLTKVRRDLSEAWRVVEEESGNAGDRIISLLPLLAHVKHCRLTLQGFLHEIRRASASPLPGLLEEMLDGDFETLMIARNALRTSRINPPQF